MQQSPERARYFQSIDAINRAKKTQRKDIVRYFPQTNFKNGHQGLGEICKKHNINVLRLEPNELVVFTNKALTAIKIFAPGYTVVHTKMPDGAGKLDMRVIEEIPKIFKDGKIDYAQGVRELIVKQFDKLTHD